MPKSPSPTRPLLDREREQREFEEIEGDMFDEYERRIEELERALDQKSNEAKRRQDKNDGSEIDEYQSEEDDDLEKMGAVGYNQPPLGRDCDARGVGCQSTPGINGPACKPPNRPPLGRDCDARGVGRQSALGDPGLQQEEMQPGPVRASFNPRRLPRDPGMVGHGLGNRGNRDQCGWQQREFGRAPEFNWNNNRRQQPQAPIQPNYGGRHVQTVKMRPDPFDGSGNFDDYLENFELCAVLNNWDRRTKSFMLPVLLKGSARDFFVAQDDDVKYDYERLTSVLKSRFGCGSKHQQYWLGKFEARVRQGESTAKLADQILLLARRAYPSMDYDHLQQVCMQQFFKSLDNEMKWRIIDRKCETLDKAVEVVETFESVVGSSPSNRSRKQVSEVNVLSQDTQFVTRLMDRIDFLENKVDQNSSFQNTPFLQDNYGYDPPSHTIDYEEDAFGIYSSAPFPNPKNNGNPNQQNSGKSQDKRDWKDRRNGNNPNDRHFRSDNQNNGQGRQQSNQPFNQRFSGPPANDPRYHCHMCNTEGHTFRYCPVIRDVCQEFVAKRNGSGSGNGNVPRH